MEQFDKQLDGSGQRAMDIVEKRIEEIKKEMAELAARAELGEIVDSEIKRIKKIYDDLIADRNRILDGGM
ncbi:MAG: hypothetical protein Q8Q37_00435 [bacterium]|nr:hypothetical protein [bacterium]